MKPKHIKKETAQRIRDGFHSDLMSLIEEGIDLYTEKTFMRGHDSFFEDASVHAYRIAELIRDVKRGSTVEDLAKIIEYYFNSFKSE